MTPSPRFRPARPTGALRRFLTAAVFLVVAGAATVAVAQPPPPSPQSSTFRWEINGTGTPPPTTVTSGQSYTIILECYSGQSSGVGPSAKGGWTKNFQLLKDGVVVSNQNPWVDNTGTAWGYAQTWSGTDTGNKDVTFVGRSNGGTVATLVVHIVGNVTITTSAGTGGTASPSSQTVTIGSTVTVTANVTGSGYTFNNWTEGGSQVSTNASYSFTASGNRSLVANFNPPTIYTLTTGSTGNGSISPGTASYIAGTIVTETGSPGTGYSLSSWSGSAAPGGNATTISITMDGNKSITANFSPNSYVVNTATSPGVGSVSGGGWYTYGSSATMTANTPTGYTFTGWTGDLSGTSNPASLPVNGTKNVTANFTINSYSVGASTSPGGLTTVTGTGTYNYGSTATLTAPAVTGYTFSSWSGSVVSSSNPVAFTVTSNANLVANYSINSYTVSTPASGSGSVSGGGTYNYGSTATLTATPSTGYYFTGWTGAINSSSNPVSIVVTSSVSATANFAPIVYTLTTMNAGNGSGSISGGGSYNYGSNATATANASTGSTFTGWSNAATGTTNPVSIAINGNKTLTGSFTLNAYTLNTSVTPAGAGSVTGAGTYNYGSNPTVAATAATKYHFVGWTGAVSGSLNPATVAMTSDKSVAANFALNVATVTVASAGYIYDGTARALAVTTSPAGLSYTISYNGGGSPSAVGTYSAVATITDPNYVGSGSGTLTITPAPLTITANDATKIYKQSNPTFTAAYSGLVGGDTPAVVSGLVIASTATTSSDAGAYSITPSGATAPNYSISFRNGTLTIDPLGVTFTFSPTSFVYSGVSQGPTVGNTSGATYALSGTAAATNASPYTFTVTANGNYTGSNTCNWSITKAIPALAWAKPPSINYPAPLGSAQLNAAANVPGAFVYSPASGVVLTPGNAQVLSVSFTPADTTNYSDAAATTAIDVNPAGQTVTISPASSTVTAGGSVVFGASGGQNAYVWGGAAGGNGATKTVGFALPGSATVTVYSAAGGVYQQSNTATATIMVNPAAQTVALTPATALLAPNAQVTITASGGQNGYVWGSSAAGSGDTKTLSFATPGSYGASVYSPAGGSFAESNLALAHITVAYPQTISFPAPGSFLLKSGSTNLTATASSGLPVRFTVLSGPGVLTSGSALKFGGLGVILIQADQDGDSSYQAAPSVRQSVVVVSPPETTLKFPGTTGLILEKHQDTNHALPEKN